jgi:hypothetical protein
MNKPNEPAISEFKHLLSKQSPPPRVSEETPISANPRIKSLVELTRNKAKSQHRAPQRFC